MRMLLSLSGLLLLTLGMAGCGSTRSTEAIPSVEQFQLERYMGRWYEIARLPNKFEKDVVDSGAYYALLPDGSISVANSGMRDGRMISRDGTAKAIYGADIGEFRVSFAWPCSSTYKVIYIDPDYTGAIVTSSTMDYLWILYRKPVMPPKQLRQYLSMLQQWGFEVKLLQYPNNEAVGASK